MELSPQETALILPASREKTPLPPLSPGSLADFLQSYGRAPQNCAIGIAGAHLNSKVRFRGENIHDNSSS
jgi:hypothetical protein